MIIMPACAGQLIDYDGRPLVTNPAPVLKFQRKTEPAPTGIDYEFAELV